MTLLVINTAGEACNLHPFAYVGFTISSLAACGIDVYTSVFASCSLLFASTLSLQLPNMYSKQSEFWHRP